MTSPLDEHLETLRTQGRHSAIALRKAADLIERLTASDTPSQQQLSTTRSQIGAALNTGRTTRRLVAQAADLLEATPAVGGTEDGNHRDRRTARVG